MNASATEQETRAAINRLQSDLDPILDDFVTSYATFVARELH